jgi:hypothetical protein
MIRFIPWCFIFLAACSSTAPTPDWQLNAQQSNERALKAYLEGNKRVALAETARAHNEVARTGRVDLLARLTLAQCAAQIASLEQTSCPRFEKFYLDVSATELTYASYLGIAIGNIKPIDIQLLPSAHQTVARLQDDATAATAVAEIADPLARLIAAGVLFQRNLASPNLIDTAIETASAQGWRRPLLAWLGLQRARAEKAGATLQVEQISRRIRIIETEFSTQ